MDQSAWERAGDEFQFSNELETLSLGSTVTNSTATLGSISSSISNQSASTPVYNNNNNNPASNAAVLIHPILRNICIIYSPKEPKKYSAIYYDYQRSLIHHKFMTRPPRIQKYHRPAPPIPNNNTTTGNTQNFGNITSVSSAAIGSSNQNDDSGCSCEDPSGLDALKEDWALAVLAAAASTKRGAGASLAQGPRSARKLRVRSQARLLLTDSVLAWREQLQRMDCCEDEEDMIVPVTDILRAQQIQEDNEVQQTQQTTILQRFKSASIGNLTELPGEEDKKSITTQIFKKFNVNRLRINRSPKSEKKVRRSQVNSLFLDDQSKYPLFGSPLKLLELNMTDHPNVPRFVVDICAYIEQPDCIEQDGLYRASGNKLLVDELKRKLTLLYDPRFLQTDDIHTLTSLHKQFFRELSAPLITQEAYERLGRQLNDEGSIERMRLAFDDMPEPNRSTLRFLIKHLTKVAAASALNRMPASNLAIVWGPCLLTANQIQFDIGRMNMLAKLLIENHDRIFRPDNERLVC
ncbi:uncharacterized protein Dwil_GK25096 [Drosophila willistoni]|uniref:Rho-GAP domain-containing protein n=2 Tax=Drosophila willistoni TaxID=7260 RepID=B4NCE4_DROWI|nr:uncharacterized protein Dwil_GK25096 [Drosophila willistoni]